jgi:hypothetical protein
VALETEEAQRASSRFQAKALLRLLIEELRMTAGLCAAPACLLGERG